MIVTDEMNYSAGETLCRGFIAYESSSALVKPAVLVVHDWGGRGKEVCHKAIELANMGYVGFAVDMYGEARTGHDKIEKRALLTPLMNNRQQLLARIQAAFDFVGQFPKVNREKIAAIGYCFGGLCVLDLARSEAAVNGVVSFHGLLSPPAGVVYRPIKSKVLILHGEDDPLVSSEQLSQFAGEMNTRQADWQIHRYGHTAHSFTNPLANDAEMGLHYNAQSARRAWQSAQQFLQELFMP